MPTPTVWDVGGTRHGPRYENGSSDYSHPGRPVDPRYRHQRLLVMAVGGRGNGRPRNRCPDFGHRVRLCHVGRPDVVDVLQPQTRTRQ